MGAWDTGVFDDDTALDAVDELIGAKAGPQLLKEALEKALGAEYIEYVEGVEALAVCGVIDYRLYGAPHDPDSDGFREWADALPTDALRELTDMAADALEAVMGSSSELQELWEESQSFAERQKVLTDIRDRLRMDLPPAAE